MKLVQWSESRRKVTGKNRNHKAKSEKKFTYLFHVQLIALDCRDHPPGFPWAAAGFPARHQQALREGQGNFCGAFAGRERTSVWICSDE